MSSLRSCNNRQTVCLNVGSSGFVLVQAYPHASSVIQSLGETDISVNLLVQVDKLVRLLETPIFAYLRLQVIFLTCRFPESGQELFYVLFSTL